jgi:hypothetical protein
VARTPIVKRRAAEGLNLVHYFLLVDAADYHQRFHPALAASWRTRSFAPCRALCESLLTKIPDFAARYQLQDAETLAASVVGGLLFDRTLWHHLVGEVLWYGAVAIPEIPTAEVALTALLAPEAASALSLRGRGVGGGGIPPLSPRGRGVGGEGELPPILQAHRGSRDLVFGGGYYRPDHAGLNDTDDVARLATYLGSVDPQGWHASDLAACQALAGEELEEELADAKAWFPALEELYRRAARDSCVVVCESL